MKYFWIATIAILLSAGAADIANATTYDDIAGQWCGDVTDYVFTPNTLTVKFHDDRPANVFKITKHIHQRQRAPPFRSRLGRLSNRKWHLAVDRTS